MNNNISQEYVLAKSNYDAKQLNSRADMNKPQPVILRVIAFILGMIMMALLQFEHSASPLAIGLATFSFIVCLQLAVDNWHTKRKLNAVINVLNASTHTLNQ